MRFHDLLGTVVVHHRLQRAVDLDDFVDTGTSLEAGMATLWTADIAIKNHRLGMLDRELLAFDRIGFVGLLAVRAQRAHQALRHQADQRGGQQKRFHAHVAQP